MTQFDLGFSHISKLVVSALVITPVFWYLPNPGWIKLNTKDATLGAPSPFSYGGIFKTSKCWC